MSDAKLSPGPLIDPELSAVLDLLPNFGNLSAETLPAIRAALAPAPLEPELDNLSISRMELPGRPGDPAVGAFLYQPKSVGGLRPALLHLHGGGFVSGSAQRDDAANRRLSAELDCVVLSLDYRLAPEAPYPAALHDAYAGLAWLHSNAEALGIDARRIAVRGNSAGGGVAAGLALLARDRGEWPIAFLALVYPMLDDRTSAQPFAGEHVWPIAANRFGWSSYLGAVASAPPIYAAPGRAEDLSGLPPVWIGCGDIDLFSIENLAFAQNLIRSGVNAELHLYPGGFHGFNLIAGASVAQRFDRDLFAALGRALAMDGISK